MPLLIAIFIVIIGISMTTGIKVDKIFSAIMNRGSYNPTLTEQGKKNLEYAKNAHDRRAISERAHLSAQQKCHSKTNSYEEKGIHYMIKYKYDGNESSCYATTTMTQKDGTVTQIKSVAYKIENLPNYHTK